MTRQRRIRPVPAALAPFLHGKWQFADDAEGVQVVGKRFDTAPLSMRATGADWRAFRREALAGEHGEDLVVRHWWRRYDYLLFAVIFVVSLPAVPLALLLTEGPTLLSVSMSVLWVGSLLFSAIITMWVRRLDHWAPKTRERFLLTEFARVNGLTYDPAPRIARPAAHLFDSESPNRHHLDRFLAPGPRGFQVANYKEERGWDSAESSWYEAGYAVFGLRDSVPHFFAAKNVKGGPGRLRFAAPTDGPNGYRIWCTKPDHPPLTRFLADTRILDHVSLLGGTTQVEIVGNQLFLLHMGGFWPLTSPAFWETIVAIADALSGSGIKGEPPDHDRTHRNES